MKTVVACFGKQRFFFTSATKGSQSFPTMFPTCKCPISIPRFLIYATHIHFSKRTLLQIIREQLVTDSQFLSQ